METIVIIAKWIFRLCICIWIITWFFLDRLPGDAKIKAELYNEPIQNWSSDPEFHIEYKGQTNTVRPVAEYEIWGVVVSHNDPHEWYRFDLTHDDKSIDTRDFCIVWGSNLKNGYAKASYLNTDWSCAVRWKGDLAFDLTKFSNNHLITNSDAIRKQIAHVNIGDQIHIKGKLVNYSEQRWGTHFRNSSTTRTDEGNGACEVVFVENLEVIDSYNQGVVVLHKIVLYIALAMLVLRMMLFFRGGASNLD